MTFKKFTIYYNDEYVRETLGIKQKASYKRSTLKFTNETFWNIINVKNGLMKFESYPISKKVPELWFDTQDHTHDKGATKYGFVYIIPITKKILGYERNILINRNLKVILASD